MADSTYLVERILRDASLFENESLVSPDLAVYEIVNGLWKHQTLLRDVANLQERIDLLAELISSEQLRLVRPDRKLLNETYALSAKHGLAIYDSVFIALALELKMELATFDGKQSKVLSEERHGKKQL